MGRHKAQEIIPKIYVPHEYWNKRAEPNSRPNPGISKSQANFIRSHITPGDGLLEIGPGVGRLFELYKACGSVTTIDLSQRYKEAVEKAARRQGISVSQHYLERVDDSLPFPSDTFDVGISSYVFIHIPFESILHAMSEMARVCRKVVVVSGIGATWPKSEAARLPSSHCFRHDYQRQCEEMDLEILESQELPAEVRFVYCRRSR